MKKANKGRTISKVKRSNQKRNKLIKKGKLKPNSKSTYIQAQENKRLKTTKVRVGQNDLNKKKKEEEEDEDMPEEDMMDEEDAMLLHRMSKSKGDDEEEELGALERKALKRLGESKEGTKKERSLLPTKTKEGFQLKTVEVDDSEEEEDEEEEEEEEMEMENGDEEEEEEEASMSRLLNGDSERSVVSLLSERETTLQEYKVQIGCMASSFTENPEERTHVLERLVQMVDKQPVHIKNVGFKLIATTVTELLKDVIPNYKIDHHSQDDGSLQKKETLRLQKYESCILNCTKSHLMKLEKVIKRPRLGESPVGVHALRCLTDLLVAHPHFNYAQNIVKLAVPYLDNASEQVRSVVKDAFEQVFSEDRRGEISLVIVRHIKSYVKNKKYACKPAAIECLLRLRLFYLETAAVEEEERKKKNHDLSKREKKRQKQLEKVEKEMLEAKGEEAKKVRNRNFTEVSKAIFEMLFRIIKTNEHSRLLPPALKCISVFCHTINVDFFDDLLRVLSGLLKEGSLKQAESLLCVKTAFDILTGPGEFLTYDPGYFTKVLYEMLPSLDLNLPECSSTVCSIIKKMLVKRKKLVSKDLVQSFAKAMAFTGLQMAPEDTVELLETLASVKAAHVRTFEGLLENEEHIPSKVASFGLGDRNVGTFSLWELSLLGSHYQRPVVEASKQLLIVRP